jgi:hypothetical protein
MKGAGTGGSDLGATVLYRYVNGTLTTTPLWDTGTGAFPCGAVVTGVNNGGGNSCNDVHTRLHVNSGGCAFPAGYGGGGTPPPVAGLLLQLRMDAMTGSTAADSTGNGYTGTLVGAPTWTPGHTGPGSLTFDGISQTVDVALAAYTWAVWAKGTVAPGTTVNQEIVSAAPSDAMGFNWSNADATFVQAVQHRLSTGEYVAAKLTTPLVANRWYYLSASYDGTTLKAYLNGQLQASVVTGPSALPQGTLRLGGGDGNQYWPGSADHLTVWNYALSDASMLAEYRLTAGQPRHRMSLR